MTVSTCSTVGSFLCAIIASGFLFEADSNQKLNARISKTEIAHGFLLDHLIDELT
jgi:hypothetical protein